MFCYCNTPEFVFKKHRRHSINSPCIAQGDESIMSGCVRVIVCVWLCVYLIVGGALRDWTRG